MKDYYKFTGIDRNLTEEELYNKLRKMAENIKKNIENGNIKDKALGSLFMVITENFIKTLNHYGSKENYDRALEIKYAKKVKVNKNFDFNKKLSLKGVALVLSAVCFIGVLTNLEAVTVQVYEGQTLEDVCESLGISPISVFGEGFSSHVNGFTSDKSVTVITSRLKSDDVRIKAQDMQKEHTEQEAPVETYGFNYIVKWGDTASGLKEKLKLVGFSDNDLYVGDDLWLKTTDPEIAKKMELQYQYDTAEPYPTDYEEYVVQPGDTLDKIAEKFNVTPQILVEFNNISKPQSIFAGQNIKVVYEYVTGQEAYEARLAEKNDVSIGTMS